MGWPRRRKKVSVEETHLNIQDAVNKATTSLDPGQRSELMNLQVVSRSPEESDTEWLARVMDVVGPLYEEQ